MMLKNSEPNRVSTYLIMRNGKTLFSMSFIGGDYPLRAFKEKSKGLLQPGDEVFTKVDWEKFLREGEQL